MESFSIFESLKKELIGKNLKITVSDKEIMQPISYWVKKSNNVTDEQFESNILKFRMKVEKNKRIGSHVIFDTFKIIDIDVDSEYSQENYTSEGLVLILENGNRVNLSLTDKLIKIEKNTYFFN